MTIKDRIIKDIRNLAKRRGYNVVEVSLDCIAEGLERQFVLRGRRLCPCIFYPPTYTVRKEDICPCAEFRKEARCRCGLYE